jgi:hypothetical protein
MAGIAVIVRNRQAEALRMSIGLTVLNNHVDIYFMDKMKRDESTESQLEAIKDLKLRMFSIVENSGFEYITPEKLAEKLLDYDRVIPY